MTQSTHEIQTTLTTLTLILHRHTTPDGTAHRPYGTDWIVFVRAMHRLLVLQGLISPTDRLPMDPWEMFLDEYAPRRPGGAVREGAAFYPTGILVVNGQGRRGGGNGLRVRFEGVDEDEDEDEDEEEDGEDGERGRERVRGEVGSGRRRIPRGVS
ncbi:uncharacterized protein BO80DRAFT_504223 [Aspergillus ibericus CBS 121593]|uniref:Uncharacterized protein n=1 Tax=Aspergillus ibericus CBS 121593 TaxID=1448316 RepID=A0A395GSA9_9EURO|nr:hypothetical protein BO80DRAFT_504223 [Aspergillus ibericus CBS 121593]RAK98309.1 hypothetical protein BO80DRAFT_504223 [Aspergillus ibericus CBS 121593]